jgi:hypothetical protein
VPTCCVCGENIDFSKFVCDHCLQPFHINSCGKAAQVDGEMVCLCLCHLRYIDKNAPSWDDYIDAETTATHVYEHIMWR